MEFPDIRPAAAVSACWQCNLAAVHAVVVDHLLNRLSAGDGKTDQPQWDQHH